MKVAPRPPTRGAALLLAMLLLVMVVTISAGMVWQQARAIEVEAAERARAQSGWIITGALDWARLILREDSRSQQRGGSNLDSLDEPWATPLAEARLSTFLAADQDNNTDTGPDAFLSGRIEDAQSRWNLRNLIDGAGKEVPAEKAALARLCQQAGLPGDTADLISAGLRQAWGPPAAEGNAAAPLAPQRLSELEWLGLAPATLRRLAPWVDVLPRPTPVNANTATREVLVAAIDGLDLGSAERLVQARQRKPFESIEDIRAQVPPTTVVDAAHVGVASSFFLVDGRLRLDDRMLEERSLLERRDASHNFDVLVLRRERMPAGMSPR